MRIMRLWMVLVLLLVGCGVEEPSSATPTVLAGGLSTISSVAAPPARPTLTATAFPLALPTETPVSETILPAGWTTVEWAGLIVTLPIDYQWQTGDLGLNHDMGDPSLQRGLDATVLDQGQIVDSMGNAGMTFMIIASEGTVDTWLTTEIKSSGDQNLIDESLIRDLRIAGHAAIRYHVNSSYYHGVISYYLRINYDQALIIRVSDAKNLRYQTVLDMLQINVPQTMPTATPMPLPCAAMPIEPFSPALSSPEYAATATASKGNRSDWQTAEWQNLLIPIPPEHFWQIVTDTIYLAGSDPIVAYAAIVFDRVAHPEIMVEAPSGIGFTLFQVAESPQEWLVRQCEVNPLSVDVQSVHETTIAGRPALVYNPMVTGTGLAQMYVVAIDAGKLVWISTDVAYANYEAVIAGIRLKE